jgi:DNA helicase-2/ATP-dependent DNA helicase PcrA
MTLHAAKGLEFPVVFIVAFEDGVLPHERVGRHPDELEEERRLAFVGLTRAKDELQLSYAVTRDFRGVRRRTIPSSFLMEMPREELELVDEATAHIAHQEQAKHEEWDEPESMEDWIAAGEQADSSTADWQLEDVSVESATADKPSLSVVAASITTAAALARETTDESAPALPRVSPDVFRQGMTVMHPEYGPGKIVALSGAGKNRRGTIQFATVGQKKIILAHSHLRPVR